MEAPSTSGPMKSPSQISGSTDSVLVSTESQPTSQQEPSCVGDQTTTIPDQPVTTGQIVQAPSTTVVNEPTSQPALVDESGTPVMLIGQPEAVLSSPSVSVTKTVTSPISGAGQRVISTMSSPVVDQSGVPVVVLGTPNPKPAPQVAATGISIINRPQIIPQAGTTNIIKKPVVQRSIVQGQKMVSHFPRVSVPGGSVLISKQGKTYLATPKHIGQPGIVAASQKIGQSTSNLLTNPVIRTPTGPVILSTKAKSSLPKAGVSGVVLVSRPHVQISNAPLILSKQKTTPDTKTAGILNYSPSSMSSITVTQPVLTVIKENPQLRIETAKTHQTSEVTSTVNGTEPEDNEPIEIPDTDEEDSSKGTGNFPSVDVKEKAEETVTEGVLQDVTMNVAKEEEKSEEELMEETNIAEQKEQQSSDEKTQQDMDSDLLMYLGGESVKENEEKVMVSSMTVLEEEKPDDRGGNINDTNEEVVEEAMEIKGEGNKEEEVQMEAEADNVEETAAQVESTTVSDEEFADDEDDGPLPAGLIRGEPIQEHHKMKDVVVEMEHVEMEKDQTGEEVKDNKDEVEKTEDEDLGMEDNSKNAVLNQQEVKLQPEVAEEEEKDRIVSEEATSTQEDDTNQEPSESNIDGRILEAEEEENELQESKSETPGEKLGTRGKGARQRGRGKRGNNSRKDSLDTPEEVHKKSFMANFNLVSPSEMEKLSQRRSKRVSNAEAVKQKEEEGEPSAATGNKVSSTVKNESYKRSETPRSSYKSYKILDDEPSGRQNIFELFDSKDIEKDDSIDSLKARIQKLLAVNAELKTRLRESDHKAASSYTSNARFHEIKALQHKVEKLEKKNSELSQRLESYEGKPSPPERTVDVSFRMGRLSFKSPAGTTQGAATAVVSSPGKPKPTEGQEKPKSRESLEKKEMKLRALDQELDQRTALLKTKEGKLQRLVMDVKSREKKVEYQESALERRVKDIEYRERMLEGKTKAALQKMNKDGGAGGFNKRQPEDTVRSAEMKRFEQELVQRKLKVNLSEFTRFIK